MLRDHLRYRAHRLADVLDNRLGTRPELARWRRERFYKSAGEFVQAIQVADREGRTYLVSTHDPWIGRALFLDGGFDVRRIDAAHTILGERGVVIDRVLDIGANIGTTTIEWLGRQPTLTGYAFEPDAKNAQLLRHNLAANGLAGRVNVLELALSDRDGHAMLEISPDNPGDHSVQAAVPLDRVSVEIRTARLDTLISGGTVSVSPETLVCMDVQGHEAAVIDGAARLFDQLPPMMCEFWPSGLRRTGGHARLLQHLARYSVLMAVSDTPRPIDVRELGAIDDSRYPYGAGAVEVLALDC